MIIYISAPYGRRRGLSERQIEKNVQTVIKVARKLIKMGHNPIVPHLYHYIHKGWKDSPDEERWYFICIGALECCEGILMYGGWKNSDGYGMTLMASGLAWGIMVSSFLLVTPGGTLP